MRNDICRLGTGGYIAFKSLKTPDTSWQSGVAHTRIFYKIINKLRFIRVRYTGSSNIWKGAPRDSMENRLRLTTGSL